MSESLRNSGRIWVPAKKEDAEAIREGRLKPTQIAEEDRDYFLERRYPAFGNLVPRDVASRAAKERCDAGFGIEANDTNEGVYLDFSSEIRSKGKQEAFAKGTIILLKKPFLPLVKNGLKKNTGTYFRCMRKSPMRIRTKHP